MPPVFFGIAYESTYSTSDKDIIEALKKHPDFNVTFFVKAEDADVPKVVEAPKPKTIEDELGDAENAIIVETVTTKGMAVAYIQGMYGESFTATTVEEMKREAAQKWNTIFPKLGK